MSERVLHGLPGIRSDIASRKSGTVRIAPIQNRRVMSSSSGFGSSLGASVARLERHAADRARARTARTTSGCIGQVYSASPDGAGATAGARNSAERRGIAPHSVRRRSGAWSLRAPVMRSPLRIDGHPADGILRGFPHPDPSSSGTAPAPPTVMRTMLAMVMSVAAACSALRRRSRRRARKRPAQPTCSGRNACPTRCAGGSSCRRFARRPSGGTAVRAGSVRCRGEAGDGRRRDHQREAALASLSVYVPGRRRGRFHAGPWL